MTPPRGYDLTAIKRVLLAPNPEIWARGLVIVGSTICVLALVGQWPVLLWTLSYVLTTLVYNLVLRRLPDLVSHKGLGLVVVLETVVMLHWPVLFVYLWSLGSAAFLCIAMLIIAAAMTSAMGGRSEDRLLRISDMFVVGVLLALMTFLVWRDGADLRLVGVAAVVAGLMLVWMMASLHEVSQLRQRLAQAERTALEQHRIEAIGRLTGGVAHDFNNILQVIGGNLDLMREVSDPSEKLALLTEARTATGRAAAVTAQLLAYSRQSVLAPRTTDIGECMARVEAFMSRLLPAAVRLSFDAVPGLPKIDIDATRLESALINLILNSRDAMPDGGAVLVTAAAQPGVDAMPESLVIAVADTGTGIDPQILSRVADPYFTTKPPGKGSGLGLSMAKGFAEQSGGHLTIRSVPGQGTVVELIVPVRPDRVANQPALSRASATMASIRSSGT